MSETMTKLCVFESEDAQHGTLQTYQFDAIDINGCTSRRLQNGKLDTDAHGCIQTNGTSTGRSSTSIGNITKKYSLVRIALIVSKVVELFQENNQFWIVFGS